MSMTNAAETALLLLLFNNTTWTNIGDAAGLLKSVGDGDFFISLHTGDPGETGDQTTSEADYTGYGRETVPRTSSGFTIAGNNVSNAAEVTFGLKTAGADDSVTHFGIGTASSGVGNLILSGALDATLLVSDGITPSFAIGALDVDAD